MNSKSEYMECINATMNTVGSMMMKEIHIRLEYAMEWADELTVPLTITEAWGPWWHMEHKDLEWQWLYDWCEKGMNLSAKYGFLVSVIYNESRLGY